MLSVVVETSDHEDELARTLAGLVGAAVEGLVREVIVYDRGSSDRTVFVAEHAGCEVLGEGELLSGLTRARGEWFLFLEPGSRLSEGWMEAVVEHVARTAAPARFARERVGLMAGLLGLFRRSRPLAAGLLVNKQQTLAHLRAGKRDDLQGLAASLSARKLRAAIAVPPRLAVVR